MPLSRRRERAAAGAVHEQRLTVGLTSMAASGTDRLPGATSTPRFIHVRLPCPPKASGGDHFLPPPWRCLWLGCSVVCAWLLARGACVPVHPEVVGWSAAVPAGPAAACKLQLAHLLRLPCGHSRAPHVASPIARQLGMHRWRAGPMPRVVKDERLGLSDLSDNRSQRLASGHAETDSST